MTHPTGTQARSIASRLALALLAVLLIAGPVVLATAAKRPSKPKRYLPVAMKGDLQGKLRPGASKPILLKLRNRRRHPVWITQIKVQIVLDKAHRLAGCSARRDFAVRSLPRRAYPIKLPARRRKRGPWRTLRALKVRTTPIVTMHDLAQSDQNACKGAFLRLRYTAKVRKSRPRARPRPAAAPASQGLTP